MTGLETHPVLGEYRLAELRREQERRARRALVLQTLRPQAPRARGSGTFRGLSLRSRGALRA